MWVECKTITWAPERRTSIGVSLEETQGILRFHVGGGYRGVRCDERSETGSGGWAERRDRAGPPRAAE